MTEILQSLRTMNTGRPAARRSATLAPVLLLAFAVMAGADSGIEQRFDVGTGGTLRVDAEGASVSVRGAGSGGATVRITRENDTRAEIEEDYRIAMRADGDDVEVVIESLREGWFDWGRNRGLKVEIEVPERYDARVKTSGGSISVPRLDGRVDGATSGGSVKIGQVTGPTEVRTSGGSVTIEESLGEVSARTSGGSIRISRAGGPVSAKTSGGSITVDEVAGAINANTSGGSIRATLTEQPAADCVLSTSGGSIVVDLAPGLTLDIDAASSGGRVSSSLALDTSSESRSELVGRLGGGGPLLKLRSSGGGVTLRSGE